jgi:phosphatidylglycerophosphatase A
MKHVLVFIATFFNIGRLPIAPGTWTSLAVILLAYFIPPYWQAPWYIQLTAAAVVFLIGIPAARQAEIHFDKEDPGQCTIDEVAGQMVALLWVPHSIGLYIASFFLFRFFDIFKPPPVHQLEKPGHGVGIMLDDIGAGLYALGTLHLGMYLYKVIF